MLLRTTGEYRGLPLVVVHPVTPVLPDALLPVVLNMARMTESDVSDLGRPGDREPTTVVPADQVRWSVVPSGAFEVVRRPAVRADARKRAVRQRVDAVVARVPMEAARALEPDSAGATLEPEALEVSPAPIEDAEGAPGCSA